MKKTLTFVGYVILLLVALFGLVQVVLGGNIDPDDKWAWGTNVGWINFAPSCDGCGGVTVYGDHLEGYAWGENIGWIRLGNLSGYAWSPTVGWINFAPNGGGVTINTATGEFAGFAWGENIGWIRFKGTAADLTRYRLIARLYHVYLPLVRK